MTPIDVRIEDVWKEYRLAARRRAPAFWALQGVSFEVARGRAMGIIGRNGAGKSTLLKLLAGITAPTRGRLTLHGRVAALIEIGSGFHPELTGRENVFLSGAMLGMRRRDLQARFDRIVDFAGVERFIDTPIKWYSSGMYVRLGFAIAAHLSPDVLLVDEVLAVGDAEFQARCLRRVHELRESGVTIILISHDLTVVEQLCDEAVLLDGGRVAAIGRPADVIAQYHRGLTTEAVAAGGFAPLAREGVLKLTNLTTRTTDGGVPGVVHTGHALTVCLRYLSQRSLRVRFELSYYSHDGRTLIARTTTDGSEAGVRPPGGTIEFTARLLPLPAGSYYLGAVARDADSGHVIDWWDGGSTLHVDGGPAVEGLLFIPHEWRVEHAGGAVADADSQAE